MFSWKFETSMKVAEKHKQNNADSSFVNTLPCLHVLINLKLIIPAKQLYWNLTSSRVFSCKFAAHFQNFSQEQLLWRAAFVTNEQNTQKGSTCNVKQNCNRITILLLAFLWTPPRPPVTNMDIPAMWAATIVADTVVPPWTF